MAYVDPRAAIDSVDRAATWELLQSLGIPERMETLMGKLLYTQNVTSEWFTLDRRVRQRCGIAPGMFIHTMDEIMEDISLPVLEQMLVFWSERFTYMVHGDDILSLDDDHK